MQKNPCIESGCVYEKEDKNNDTCRECDLRVNYVQSLGGMTHSVPEEPISLSELNRKNTPSVIPACVPVTRRKQIERRRQVIENLHRKHIEKINFKKGKGENMEDEKKSAKPDQETCVMCHDPGRPILNKRSKTCRRCYLLWNKGNKDHPTLGKFVPSQIHVKSKTTKPKIETQTPADQEYQLPKPITLNLEQFPKIKAAIYDTAEKYFVTPEHVIIGLLGEALASRKGAKE